MLKLLRSMVILASLLPALAGADPVRLFVAGAAKAGIEALRPSLVPAGGSLEIRYDTAGALRDRVLQGDVPDLVILSDTAVDALAARGLVRDGERHAIGVVVAGLAVRAGTPSPDISSPEALRRTLLAATSIGCADGAHGATSGAHFNRVLDRLGIREQVANKLTLLPTGVDVLHGVAAGQFELGVSQSSEILPVPGLHFVGALPAPYELRTAYTAAVVGGSAAGQRLMRLLESTEAQSRFEASGFSKP